MEDLFTKFDPAPEDVPDLESSACPELNQVHNPTKSLEDSDNAALLFANLRKDVPGLAISDFPRAFLIQVKKSEAKKAGLVGANQKTYQVFTMPVLWAKSKAAWPYFKECFTVKPPAGLREPWVKPGGWVDPDRYETKPLKNWDYGELAAKCAPGKEPSEYDLPNPRLYWPDGTQAYVNEPWWPHWIRGEFKRMIVDLWKDALPLKHSTRANRLFACFDYHKNRGGNASAFVEYVQELCLIPPPSFDPILVRRMKDWWEKEDSERVFNSLMNPRNVLRTDQQDKVQSNVLDKALDERLTVRQKPRPAASANPAQHVIARVHAYRFLKGDKEADINPSNDSAVAKSYGWVSSSSGRAIRNLYNRFTQRSNSKAERIGHPSKQKAKEHMINAIKLLKVDTDAVKMARTEFDELVRQLGEDQG
jgi:hypothetical protein